MNECKNGDNPVRVAHIIGKLSAAGVEAVIINYYKHIDHNKYQFDFFYDSDSTCEPKQEMIEMGARYYKIPPYQNIFQHIKTLIHLFKENKYKIVHSNMNSLAVFSLFAAWIAKVPNRINHNHSTSAPGEIKKNILKYALRPFSKIFATHLCACSKLAGEWLFGKKAVEHGEVLILTNAIEIDRFAFNSNVRNDIRKEFGIEDAFVIGHVGRFCYQKNQEFLINVFSKIHKHNPKAILLLIGIGETMKKIRDQVHNSGLDKYVIFTGARNDVERLYQAMDVFVFPSRYEGLGIVTIEAQCSGLFVLASNYVPLEAKASNHISFIPLESMDIWVDSIQNIKQINRFDPIDEKFNIEFECQRLENFYDQILEI